MPTPDLHPTTVKLMRRMTDPAPSHARFVGEPIDVSQIDELALGDLWTLAHRTTRHNDSGSVRTLAAETAWMI